MYKVKILEKAQADLDWFRRHDRTSYIKCFDLVREIIEHPRAEWKYLIQGATFKGRGISVVTKMSITGKLVIITVYAT